MQNTGEKQNLGGDITLAMFTNQAKITSHTKKQKNVTHKLVSLNWNKHRNEKDDEISREGYYNSYRRYAQYAQRLKEKTSNVKEEKWKIY